MADDRPHDGRGHWLDATPEDVEVKLLREIAANLRSIRSIMVFWSVVAVLGIAVAVALMIAAAAQTAN